MNNEYRQSGWYAPMAQEKAEKADAENTVRKEKGTKLAWRIVLGLLLVCALLVGSSLFFAKRAVSGLIAESKNTPARDDGFNFMLPGDIPGFGKDEGEDEEMPEDWKDFFDSFYVSDSKREDSRIAPVETRPEWELELKPVGKQEMTLQEIYQNCVDSIVSIRSYVDDEVGYYWGSGIILTEDGLILTNAHLIEGCDTATVITQDNTEYETMLVGEDGTSDIAVLKIDAEGLTPAEFGESDKLTVGEAVAAIGNPLGEEFRATLTNGIVSAIDRGMNYGGHSLNLIQTNTAINEGNSGGALLNMYGQVIGVTNMKMMSSYSSIEGIGFAIPSSTVRSIVNALIRDGEVLGRPALGITVGPIPEMAVEHYELPEGLYVSAVSEGSDAEKKGIREGDIITDVNGEPARTTDDILTVRDTLSVGDTMRFTIWRDGESFDVDVELMESKDVY